MAKAKCPKCSKELDYLMEERVQHALFRVTAEADWSLDSYGDVEQEEYYCPECNEKLFDNTVEAIDFLNNKQTDKQD